MTNEFINITWQQGPVDQVGVNGAALDEALDAVLQKIAEEGNRKGVLSNEHRAASHLLTVQKILRGQL